MSLLLCGRDVMRLPILVLKLRGPRTGAGFRYGFFFIPSCAWLDVAWNVLMRYRRFTVCIIG